MNRCSYSQNNQPFKNNAQKLPRHNSMQPIPPIPPIPPIAQLPRPACLCASEGVCQVRVLHAAPGLSLLRVFVSGRSLTDALAPFALSTRIPVEDGFRTVSVFDQAGGLLLCRQLPFRAGDALTLAVVVCDEALGLEAYSDIPCANLPRGLACLRLCSLSPDCPPLDLALADGRTVFSGVRFREATPFKTIRPAVYDLSLCPACMRTPVDIETIEDPPAPPPQPGPLLGFSADMVPHATYSAFVLGRVASPALKILLAADS